MKNRKYHIGYVLNSLQHGGVERYVLNLYKNLNREVFIPHIFCLRQTQSPMEEELKKEKIDVMFVPRKIGTDFQIYKKLAKQFTDKDIDLIHSNNWGTFLESAVSSTKVKGLKHLHVQHGLEFDEQNRHNFIKFKIMQTVRKFYAKKTSHYVSVSETGKKYLQEQWNVPPEKVMVIYNGIETERFKPQPETRFEYRKLLGLDENQFVIGSVGRFHTVKNWPLLITAMKGLESNIPGIKLFLIGGSDSSPLYPSFKNIVIENQLQNTVKFLFKRNDIDKVLQAFDSFVLPSKSEGLSISILEALSSGIPVIASNVGGNPELIKPNKTGLLFESENLSDLQNRIITLYENKDLRENLIKSGRQLILEKFTQTAMIKAYEDSYKECINN